MILDSVVYSAEGNYKAAVTTLALAALFHKDVNNLKFAERSYKDLSTFAPSGKKIKAAASSKAEVEKFIDASGKKMEEMGLPNISADAKAAVSAGIDPGQIINQTRMSDAAAACKEMMTTVNGKSRLKQAYDDIKELAQKNRETHPEGHPGRYSVRAGETTDASRAIAKHDYPMSGRVPEMLSPAADIAGRDILTAWANNADKQFFQRDVKSVHGLGFSKAEFDRTASQALDAFLDDAPFSGNVQISTVGYTGQINPGPRAGASFREGLEGTQIQVGIKLKGDVAFATTGDSFTTNRGGRVKAQLMGARAGTNPPPKFRKVPRPEYMSDRDIVGIRDASHPLYDPELRAEYTRDLKRAKEASIEKFGSDSEWFDFIPDRWLPKTTANHPVSGCARRPVWSKICQNLVKSYHRHINLN
jgi:hypothetical protein